METIVKPRHRRFVAPAPAISYLLAVLIILFPLATATAATMENEETVMVFILDNDAYTVNGELITMEVCPTIVEGRTMLPIRYAATPLGADVGWDDTTRKVTVSLEKTVMELWIGESKAFVNGDVVPIDDENLNVKPLIINGRTMLPVRFVVETLGCEVQWDPETRKVTITKTGSQKETGKLPGIPDIKLSDSGKLSDNLKDSAKPSVSEKDSSSKTDDIKLPGLGKTPDLNKDTGKLPELDFKSPDIGKLPIINYEIQNIDDMAYYENYYGTVLTMDAGMLGTPNAAYKWGITNDKDLNLQYFTFYLKPGGKYKNFRASFFLDSSSKADLVMNIRKDTNKGLLIKSLTLKPGETLKDINVEIGGIEKLCIESNIKINHGVIKKIVVGDPIFYNSNL